MFNLFKKKSAGQVVTLKIDGMHCASCSLNIDGDLEDTPGVIRSTTSYAKSETIIEFDPAKVDEVTLRKIIEKLEYKVL